MVRLPLRIRRQTPRSHKVEKLKNEITVLSPYPISNLQKTLIESKVGPYNQAVSVFELKKQSVPRALKNLSSLQTRQLIIWLEEADRQTLQNIMLTLALFTSTQKITLLTASEQHTISKKQIAGSLLVFVWGFVLAWWSALRMWAHAFYLSLVPAQKSQAQKGVIAYFKTNLWFGIKAGGAVGHIRGVIQGFLDHARPIFFMGIESPPLSHPAYNYKLVPPPAYLGFPSEFNNFQYCFQFVKSASEKLRQQKTAFIYQRMSIGNIAGVILARRHKCPLVLEYNGSEVWVARKWGKKFPLEFIFSLAEKVCLKHAQVIVTVSDVLADSLVAQGVPRDKIVMYPNCVDTDVYNSARWTPEQRIMLRQKWGIPTDATVLTFIGTFGKWHGVSFLAETYLKLYQQNPAWVKDKKLHFLFVGDGLLMNETRAIASQLPPSMVTFTGLVDQEEAPAIMAFSDILMSPHVPNVDGSRFFGSPTKVFEYMAMGKPIISSSLEQLQDVLHPGFQPDSPSSAQQAVAYLCVPGSHEAFVKAIQTCVENPQVMSLLAQNARQKAVTHYTWYIHTDKILEKIPYAHKQN